MTLAAKAGRYELIEEIGRGAMGIVYRANDPVIGRPVAVKTMRLANAGSGLSNEELLSRFQTEARAAGRLTHPNIVVVYDAGEENGVLYITMELVEGPSLQALIEARQTFPLPRILRVMEQACSALDFAHQHNIVHRDIKPANLMLTADDTLKITDFGTAKILQYGTMQTAQAIGTPSYMSPEQIKGRRVDGRSDIFSLGVVLYELVTGQKPFPGDSVTTVIYKIVNENPVPPREIDSSIHPGLAAVISKALAKPVEDRFQTCRAFFEALQNYTKYQNASTEATTVLPRSAMLSVPAVEAERMSEVRAAGSTPALPTGRTHHPSGPPARVERPHTSPWIASVLLAIIAAAGYQVFPALQEVWLRSQSDRAAAENALRAVRLSGANGSAETTTVPETAAASPVTEQAPVAASDDAKPQMPALTPPVQAPLDVKQVSTSAPGAEDVQQSPSPIQPAAPLAGAGIPSPVAAVTPRPSPGMQTPAKAKTSIADTAGVPSKETPAASVSSEKTAPGLKDVSAPSNAVAPPYKPSRLPPTPAAAVWQARIRRILVQSGIDGQVQATASGATITLTGKLQLAAHRSLLARLQDIPDRLQVIDDIDYAAEQSSDASDETPSVAAPSQTRLR